MKKYDKKQHQDSSRRRQRLCLNLGYHGSMQIAWWLG